MAYQSTTPIQSRIEAQFNEFTGSLRTLARKYRVYLRTREELSSLDERDLNDIGIARADIGRIAREHAGLGRTE